jgi:hypothetical protein
VSSLRAIGFWFNEAAPGPYPRPQDLVGRWPAARRRAVIAYLEAGATFEAYPAWSFCRFGCGIAGRAMGRRDLTDGVWVWPEGLAHYVEAHGVSLPDAFVAAVGRGVIRPAPADARIDDRPWLAWGRAQGACLDLRGWELPGAAARSRIAAAMQPLGVRGEAVVARPGQVVIRRGARLWKVTVRPRVKIEALSGWDRWPRYRA